MEIGVPARNMVRSLPSIGRPAALAAAFLASSFSVAQAPSQCAAFPEVSWWGNLTHEDVIRYVNQKHEGEWTPYLEKWENQLDTVQRVYDRKSAVVIKAKGITLEGKALRAYIEKIRIRVEVNRCLAKQAGPG